VHSELPRADPITQRAELAQKIRALLLAKSPQVEGRASRVSNQTAQGVKAALHRGAEIMSRSPEPNLQGYIVGFDLGTSSVKCAYRQPYTAGDPVRALSVPPELRSFDHPCLWQSVVWFAPDTRRFSLIPFDGAVAIDGFKSGLIRGDGRAWASDAVHVSKAEAMTAFSAMMIAYILGSYDIERPLGTKGRDHFLSVNLGIPVAARDDRVTSDIYAKVLAAARDLSAIAGDLTLDDVRTAVSYARPERPSGFQLIPELTAAIAGYASDPTAPDGAHILVDVGASTLDIVAFNLNTRTRISVFTACVELLGAAALEDARRAGISDSDFKRACDAAFDRVYGGARKPQRAPKLFHPGQRRRYVQLVKTGGGCRTAVHEQFISEMTKATVLGDVPAIEPMPPGAITDAECDKGRLLLAYGLTRDLPELLDLRLPSEIDDLPPPSSPGPPPITKDDM
jgi:hypothetical protein